MLGKILTIYKGDVVIDESILSIPEFKALWEKRKEIQDFQYLWALYDPESPYSNLDELEKEYEILKDYPKVKRQDPLFVKAQDKCEKLYMTPLRKLLRGVKSSIERLSLYLETTEIEHGRDGNLNQIVNAQKSLALIVKNYQSTEDAYKQEFSKNRGDYRVGVDEDYDDEL